MRRCRCRGPRTRNSHSEIESISHSTRTPRSRARQPHTRFAQRRHATRGHTPHILYVHAGRAAPRASDLSRSRLLNTHPKLPRLHRLDLHEQTFVDHAQERTRTADTAPSHDTCDLLHSKTRQHTKRIVYVSGSRCAWRRRRPHVCAHCATVRPSSSSEARRGCATSRVACVTGNNYEQRNYEPGSNLNLYTRGCCG